MGVVEQPRTRTELRSRSMVRIRSIPAAVRLRPDLLLAHMVLSLFFVASLMPIVWMFLSAFKTGSEIVQFPPTLLPNRPTADNFVTVLTQLDFVKYLTNSLIVVAPSTLIVLLTSSASGYVFAKYQFWGRDALCFAILSTLMIPFSVVLLPLFLLFSDAGQLDTYQALVVPTAVSSFGIFVMRQSMRSIPDELIQDARVDGASEWWIYAQIIVPLSLPAMAVLAIFHFVSVWDSFLWPLAVVNETAMRTLPLGLAGLQSERGTRFDLTIAGAVVTVLPILVIYALAQKQFIRGIAMTGIKG